MDLDCFMFLFYVFILCFCVLMYGNLASIVLCLVLQVFAKFLNVCWAPFPVFVGLFHFTSRHFTGRQRWQWAEWLLRFYHQKQEWLLVLVIFYLLSRSCWIFFFFFILFYVLWRGWSGGQFFKRFIFDFGSSTPISNGSSKN